MNANLLKICTYLGIFLVIAGLSYFAFNKFLPVNLPSQNSTVTNNPTVTPSKTGVLTFTGPKTAVCPINGVMYTEDEKNIWSTRRPMIVMIENQLDARPQSGFSNADIVYEAVAEGGITRMMGVFYCAAVKGAVNKYDVGPVRSARTYFLDLASEYSDYPLYVHVGGANCSAPTDPVTGRVSGACTTDRRALALEQISQYGWQNKGTWSDMSEFSLSYQDCRREPDRTGKTVDTEHTMYCNTSEIWKLAASRGLSNMTAVNNNSWDKSYRPWSFKQADQAAASPAATNISFDFWSGYKDYSVAWAYDAAHNYYLRSNGGQPVIDFNTNQQLNAKNVVIEFAKESRSIDSHLHNLYAVIGTGTGLLFQNGIASQITWSKPSRMARTIFKDQSGKEVNFVPGQVWVEIVPAGNTVTY